MNHRTAAFAPTRFRGLIRTVITISPPDPTSNSRASIISRASSRAAADSTAWVLITKETVSPGALLPPTTATCPENTGPRGKLIRRSSLILALFKGPAVPANQIHDFHPPISPEGLYWVTPVPQSGLTFSHDGKIATLEMEDVPIIDQPRWPAMDAEATPAFLDFKLVFTSTGESVKYEDPARQYRFEGFKANAELEPSVRVPSIEFSFKTDPFQSSKADFAVMGEEVNGRYYE